MNVSWPIKPHEAGRYIAYLVLVSLVLFGSRGRKRGSSRSDTDLLVISRDVNENVEREISKIRTNYLLEGVKIDTASQ